MRCGLSTQVVDGAAVVSVRGELDRDAAPAFEHELSTAVANRGATAVVVDLARCRRLDPSALEAMVATNRLLGYPRYRVTLVVDDPSLVSTIRLSGLDYVFTICPSRAAAGLHEDADGS